jgi:hypothetical protein
MLHVNNVTHWSIYARTARSYLETRHAATHLRGDYQVVKVG